MPPISFACAACGFTMHCEEGAGESFQCPQCNHVGVVPFSGTSPPDARPGRFPSQFVAPWQSVARGLRVVSSVIWIVLLVVGIVLVLNVAMLPLWEDFNFTQPRMGPGARAFMALSLLLAGILAVLLDLLALLGQWWCLAVPTGEHSKGLAAVSLMFALLGLLGAISLGLLGFDVANKPLADKSRHELLAAVVLAVLLFEFVRWGTFVAFLRTVARTWKETALARNAGSLALVGCSLFVLMVLLSLVPAGARFVGEKLDPATTLVLLAAQLGVGVAGLGLVFWSMVVLRRTERLLRTRVKGN